MSASIVEVMRRVSECEDADELLVITRVFNAFALQVERVAGRREFLPEDIQKLGGILAVVATVRPEGQRFTRSRQPVPSPASDAAHAAVAQELGAA